MHVNVLFLTSSKLFSVTWVNKLHLNLHYFDNSLSLSHGQGLQSVVFFGMKLNSHSALMSAGKYIAGNNSVMD